MTKVSVNAPKTPVTEGSSGVAAATLPNVCKMPGPPAPFVPTPLPNIGKSGTDPKNYSKSVTIEGKKVAIRGATFGSMGDVASKGTGGGIVSSNVEGPTSFVGPGSMDTKIEGKNVQLLGDPMLNNCGPSGSPANAATMMGLVQMNGSVTVVTGEDKCPLCRKRHGQDIMLKETPATKASAERLAQRVTMKVRSGELPNSLATMLGVIQCKCGKKKTYADHSGITLQGVCDSITGLEWVAPAAGSTAGATQQTVKSFLKGRFKHRAADIDKMWERLGTRANESKAGATSSAAYPPGSCAGPKALVLTLAKKAYPGSLTERWFHSRKNPVDAKIKFRDAVSGEEVEDYFGHGKTVPPCLTCNVIIPSILCPENQEMKCQHPE
ncbi:PAAR-like domain-containing protein [Archangium sp.]|uniref:PAAR-like domain-containing protein n=1 Tax=Archangium sp. TaxID=1872627 RepID=UPI002D33E4FC|nr:PAAR-like domain-containing protein [Archangium sp.]HYO59402.1 PAAR-like domain-containing protein [Archangium sp.]